MRNEDGKISGVAMVLLGVVLLLAVGVVPILDLAYDLGLYSKPAVAAVDAEYVRKGYAQSAKCQEGLGGWSFVCDAVISQRRHIADFAVASRTANPPPD